MKILIHITIYLLLLTGTRPVKAQDVTQQRLKWTASEVTDVKTGLVESNTSQFITSTNQIEWIQKGGQRVYTFTITQTIGAWLNVAQEGAITFQLNLNNKPGSITIQKSNGATLLTLIYRPDEASGIHMKYQINSIETVTP